MIDDRELVRLLDEDCPYGDLTTVGLGIGSVPAQARLVARSEMTLAGVEQAAQQTVLDDLEGDRVHAPSRVTIGSCGSEWP